MSHTTWSTLEELLEDESSVRSIRYKQSLVNHGFKLCTHCGLVRGLGDFYPVLDGGGRLGSRCRQCWGGIRGYFPDGYPTPVAAYRIFQDQDGRCADCRDTPHDRASELALDYDEDMRSWVRLICLRCVFKKNQGEDSDEAVDET